MKSFYLVEKCDKCQSELFVYRKDTKFMIDCSQCNEFIELEFDKLREIKKKYNIKEKI